MLRIILALLFLTSCSLGVQKSGGDRTHVYDSMTDYSEALLKEMAPGIVQTTTKEPNWGKNEKLFDPKLGSLKRVGIIVFESSIQPTRSGLAGEDLVYLSAQGKQLLTEKLLTIWEETFSVLKKNVEYVPTKVVGKAHALTQYGQPVEKLVHGRRHRLAPDDIFYAPKGKATTMETVVNPRRLRDLSLFLVPATEMMLGPKWSEQHKHLVNDIAKELKLDAVIVVYSSISWTKARKSQIDSNEMLPEEITLKMKSSILVPFSGYHARLKAIGLSDEPTVNLPYKTYEEELKIPVLLSVAESDQTFSTIEKEVLTPTMKTYRDMTIMMIDQMVSDLQKTF